MRYQIGIDGPASATVLGIVHMLERQLNRQTGHIHIAADDQSAGASTVCVPSPTVKCSDPNTLTGHGPYFVAGFVLGVVVGIVIAKSLGGSKGGPARQG